MTLKNPVTTIIGIIQMLISLIAAVFPSLFGFDWTNLEFQQALLAGLAAVGNGIFGLINMFVAKDSGGGL